MTFGAFEFEAATGTPGGSFGPGRIDTRVYVSHRVTGAMTWDAARSDWSLQAYWDQREYAAGGQDAVTFTEGETYSGIRAATRWQAFSRTRVDVDAWWEKRRLAQGDLGLLELTLALVRNLTPQIEARLAVTWSEQNANSATLPEFKAGTAFLGVVWRR